MLHKTLTVIGAIGLSMLLQGSGLAQIAPDRPPCIENFSGKQCPFEPGSHKAQPKENPPDTKPHRASGRKENPDMEGREGVPPSAATGSRAIDEAKRWCKWGEDPKTDGCDNLGSGVGG